MSEAIIVILVLLILFMGWSLSQAMKTLTAMEYKYASLSVDYTGTTMAMHDIRYSKRDRDEKLNAYYGLADRMMEDRLK